MRQPNPVVCGRRVCNGPCGRWRPITDFKHRAERSARRGFYVLGVCNGCARACGRDWYKRNAEDHKANVRVWQEQHPELVEGYRQISLERRKTPEGRARERDYQQSRRDDPVMGPIIREYFRVYRNMKRHELGEGYAEKAKGSRSEHSYRDERDLVPSGPFVNWLETYFPKGRLQPLAKKLGVDEAFLRRIIKGETTDKSGKTVPYVNVTIGLVDRALHASGRETQLIDLYPHLYT